MLRDLIRIAFKQYLKTSEICLGVIWQGQNGEAGDNLSYISEIALEIVLEPYRHWILFFQDIRLLEKKMNLAFRIQPVCDKDPLFCV